MTMTRLAPGRLARDRLADGPLAPILTVAFAALFLAVLLAAELPPPGAWSNDLALHVSLVRGLLANRTLDFWHTTDLGYPVMRLYQPLWHLGVASLHLLTGGAVGLDWLVQLSVCALAIAFPAGVFVGARRWLRDEGLDAPRAGWAAAAMSVLAAVSVSFTGFGFDPLQGIATRYGVVTQTWSLVFFFPAFAWSYAWLANRTHSPWPGLALSVLCAGTSLIVGLQLVASVCVRGLVDFAFGADPLLPRRTAAWLAAFAAVTAFLWWPLVADMPWVYYPASLFSPWVNQGFGQKAAFAHLASGRLLDGATLTDRARWPLMTLLTAAGAALLVLRWRRQRALATFLLGGWVLWFSLFVGRDAWGGLLYALPLLRSYQWGRVETLLQLWATAIVAVGAALAPRPRRWPAAASAAVAGAAAVALAVLAYGPWRFARDDRHHLDAVRLSSAPAHVRDVVARLAGDPTRTYVGGPTTWEARVKDGGTWLGVALTAEGVPTVGRIYQGMDLASSMEYFWDARSTWGTRLLGIGNMLVPPDLASSLPLLGAPVEVAPGVGLAVTRAAPPLAFFSRLAAGPARSITEAEVDPLLRRALREAEHDVFLPFRFGPHAEVTDLPGALDPLPGLDVTGTRFVRVAPGVHESRVAVNVAARGAIVFPVPFHPGLTATVDGQRVAPFPVVPGYAAVPVAAGAHAVLLAYRSSHVKDALFVLALAVLAWGLVVHRRLGTARA